MKKRWWSVFLSLLAIEVVFLIKMLTTDVTLELLFSILIMAVLMTLVLRIENLNSLSITREGLEAKLTQVEQKVDQIGDDIDRLLISTVLDAYEYITLKKIRGDKKDDQYYFSYQKGRDLLERLRNRGLIEEKQESPIFNSQTIQDPINLRSHFLITELGINYLEAINNKGLGQELEKIIKN